MEASRAWAALGSGISALGYRVYNHGANLYVGGNFLAAGGKLADGIAGWDGANWSAIGTVGHLNGIYLSPTALASDGTNLFAGGASLYFAGQTNVNMVARFDGANWLPLGGGLSGSSVISGPIGTTILTLALTNNLLYAGGYFTNAGGVPVNNIAVWNGTNWSALGNPGGVVASILVGPQGVYACGASFYNLTGYNGPYFSLWNGAAWSSSVINFNYPPYTSTDFHFDDPVLGMAATAAIGTNIFIAGHFDIGETTNFPNYVYCDNIMRFDGANAWIMGTGLNSNVTRMAALGTNLYVAGTFTNAGGVAASKIAMWNGNYWTNLGTGLVGTGVINALTGLNGNLYAGGTFTNMGGVAVNHIAQWNGANWSALGQGITYPGQSSAPVTALASSGSDLFVGGTFRQAGDKPSFSIARWNARVNFNIPQLVNTAPPANGQYHCRLYASPGLTNVIQATTNLVSWAPVLTNTVGIFDFTDSNAAAYRQRFYRAVLSQ